MALSLMVLKHGAGRHVYALGPSEQPLLFQWLVSAQLTYTIALWVCRVSGIAFYARVAPVGNFVWWLWTSLVFVTIVFVAQLLILALQCIPLAALWGEVEGKCLGSKAVFISTAAMTIVCDSIILFLPIGIIIKLQATLTRKISLGIVLCFGVL